MNNRGFAAMIAKIFPAPTCFSSITHAGVNKTEEIYVNTTRNGLFLTTEMLINNSLSVCSALSIYCFIRTSKINIFFQPGNCIVKEDKPLTLIPIITVVVVITIVAIFGFIVCKKRRPSKKKDKPDENPSNQLLEIDANKAEKEEQV